MKGNRVIILGGGPAGLAAGYHLTLAQQNWQVQVLEKDCDVGGLAKTLVYKDFRFDIGGHRWFTKNEELNQFLLNLLGDEIQMTPRLSRIYFEGKFYYYPIRIGNALFTMGPLKAIFSILDFFHGPDEFFPYFACLHPIPQKGEGKFDDAVFEIPEKQGKRYGEVNQK